MATSRVTAQNPRSISSPKTSRCLSLLKETSMLMSVFLLARLHCLVFEMRQWHICVRVDIPLTHNHNQYLFVRFAWRFPFHALPGHIQLPTENEQDTKELLKKACSLLVWRLTRFSLCYIYTNLLRSTLSTSARHAGMFDTHLVPSKGSRCFISEQIWLSSIRHMEFWPSCRTWMKSLQFAQDTGGGIGREKVVYLTNSENRKGFIHQK